MDNQMIIIPPFCLEWSEWYPWNKYKIDVRKGGIRVPKSSGVYEVKYINSEERLTIGKTGNNLDHRIRASLVKGNYSHSSGERIRAAEDVSQLLVRWACTERPAAAEEELHNRYRIDNGHLPKYTLSMR
jgi:hypothetical protein